MRNANLSYLTHTLCTRGFSRRAPVNGRTGSGSTTQRAGVLLGQSKYGRWCGCAALSDGKGNEPQRAAGTTRFAGGAAGAGRGYLDSQADLIVLRGLCPSGPWQNHTRSLSVARVTYSCVAPQTHRVASGS